MRRPNFMASRYTTERPDQVIPFLPDAPTDVDWTTTTTWDAWADYISQRGKWAGGVECRALNEVFVHVGSRIRINFISDEHQQIFGTELNSPQSSEKLLLLTSGHFQLLRPLEGHRDIARISETHKEKPLRDHRANQQQKRAQAPIVGNPKITVR